MIDIATQMSLSPARCRGSVLLPHKLAPGEQVTLIAATVAPKDSGKYRLQWSLVVEGVAWFYELNARTLDLPVEVTAPEHA